MEFAKHKIIALPLVIFSLVNLRQSERLKPYHVTVPLSCYVDGRITHKYQMDVLSNMNDTVSLLFFALISKHSTASEPA